MALFTIALDSDGRKINIENAQRRGKYTCINCGESMMAKKGQQREWHFSHHSVTEQCNHDTWLHRNILDLLIARLEQSESIVVDCQSIQVDLTDNLGFEREKKYDELFPDILVKRNDDVLFVEICVTSPCSKEKVASGHKIIELFTSDSRVLDELSNGNIHTHAKYYNLVLHNFEPLNHEELPSDSNINIPDILSDESGRSIGGHSENTNHDKPPRNGISLEPEATTSIPQYEVPHCPQKTPFSGNHASFFILHADRSYEIKGNCNFCSSDLLVLGINTIADFAINIGKSYAWRKGLLDKEVLTEYEQHIDMPAVIQSFNIVEFKI